MKRGRVLRPLACVVLLGCLGSPARDGKSPESLGALPDDLPLPPGFSLDPEVGESGMGEGEGARWAVLHLRGTLSFEEVRDFFFDHLRLARWKPVDHGAEPGVMIFKKGSEKVVVKIEGGDEGGSSVTVALNPRAEVEQAHER